MMLRLPQNFEGNLQIETGESVLNAEILAEKAASLGNAGRAVERELFMLKQMDSGAPEWETHLRKAADAVYSYFVQRELCGFKTHEDAIEQYAIPASVLARLGSR